MNKISKIIYNIIRGDKFMKKTYTIAVHESEQETGYDIPKYWAQCVELPGVFTDGDTIEEIKTNMREAIKLMLEDISEEEQQADTVTKYIALEVQNA